MGMTNAQLRAHFGLDSPSGESSELLDVPTSMSGAGLRSALAGFRGGLGHLGAALGMDNADYIRRMEDEAAFYQRNAPGTTEFTGEKGVLGEGKLSEYIPYILGQMVPYAGEAALGAIAGTALAGPGAGTAIGAGTGLRGISLAAAKTLGKDAVKANAAKRLGTEAVTAAAEREALEAATRAVANKYAAGAGAAGVMYPGAVGDILGNQAEVGEYNLPMALAGGIPYVGAELLLGAESAVAKGMARDLVRKAAAEGGEGVSRGVLGTGLDMLKSTARGENLPGAMVRGGVKTGLGEGVGETGQELINQMFGRMVANPEEGLFTGDAPRRYAESFAGGFFGGGPVGALAPVFAKPTAESPDAIASRADTLSRSLEQIQTGNETWREAAERDQKAAEAEAKKQAAEVEKGALNEAARMRTASLGEDIATAAPVESETSPLADMIETMAIKNMLAKDEAAKAEAEAKAGAIANIMGLMQQQEVAQREQQNALLSGAQPDMFPDATMQGPSPLPAPDTLDVQPEPSLVAEARFVAPEGKRATPASIPNLPQGVREVTPLVTAAGKPAAKPKSIQPADVEDLVVDLGKRIDVAVAARDIPPEAGARLSDALATVEDYRQFKAIRTQFETLKETQNDEQAQPVQANETAQRTEEVKADESSPAVRKEAESSPAVRQESLQVADNEADAADAVKTLSALPGRTLSSKKSQIQVELETPDAFTGSMSPLQAVEFTNTKIRAYEAMIKTCLGG